MNGRAMQTGSGGAILLTPTTKSRKARGAVLTHGPSGEIKNLNHLRAHPLAEGLGNQAAVALVVCLACAHQATPLALVCYQGAEQVETAVYRPATGLIRQLLTENRHLIISLLGIAELDQPHIANADGGKGRDNPLTLALKVPVARPVAVRALGIGAAR